MTSWWCKAGGRGLRLMGLLAGLMAGLLVLGPARALTPAQALAVAQGETDERMAALQALMAQPDARTAPLLQALAQERLKLAPGPRVLIATDTGLLDAVTGAAVSPAPEPTVNTMPATGAAVKPSTVSVARLPSRSQWTISGCVQAGASAGRQIGRAHV